MTCPHTTTTIILFPIRGGQLEPNTPPTDKDLLVYKDPSSNKLEYLDLRTGKPYTAYIPVSVGKFSNELADLICEEIRLGVSLKKICLDAKIQQGLFYAWLSIFPEFKKRYNEARKQRADYHFNRALDLADSAIDASKDDIPGLKLAIDTHKWATEKSDPERFAKPKEEGNNVGSVVIHLTTGVLDRAAPKDIVVDQYGNFQGFGEAVEVVEDNKQEIVIEFPKNRWTVDDKEEPEEE